LLVLSRRDLACIEGKLSQASQPPVNADGMTASKTLN
jgi:hypothetical protein